MNNIQLKTIKYKQFVFSWQHIGFLQREIASTKQGITNNLDVVGLKDYLKVLEEKLKEAKNAQRNNKIRVV